MEAVIQYARLRNWMVYHPFDSRRSCPGFPDLVLIRGKEVRVAELKVGKNRPTAAQLAWLDAFRAAGIPADVWTPADWATIERILG